ncbi:MAG TPA: NAD(P)-dependent oxidoreductase [Modicisalibacter sp.]|nr:NAD(P)-dependent oxidoreductase [Modicisalibacter sp.]
MNEKPSVGFIGLGLMGQGMAESLLKENFSLTIMAHRNRAPIEALRSLGAHEVSTPAEVASRSDVVVICVSTSEQVEQIICGNDGILAGANEGLVIVDCSTALPYSTQRIAATVERAGCRMIDAPLARTPKEAREGRLNVMLGGDEETIARARPVIEAFAENIFHVGTLGSAHKLKLINNFLSLGAAALVAEAATMAEKLGVDQRKLFEVCSLGGANSAMLGAIMPWVIDGDDSRIRFSLGNATKDMAYLEQTLSEAEMASTMLAPLREALVRAGDDLGKESFVPMLFDACAKRNGIDIADLHNRNK